jgi:hypothetical protein
MLYIELRKLVEGTVFAYEGKEYKTTQQNWTVPGLNRENTGYLGPRNDAADVIQCFPKLGSQFQPQMKVWFNKDTTVGVE